MRIEPAHIAAYTRPSTPPAPPRPKQQGSAQPPRDVVQFSAVAEQLRQAAATQTERVAAIKDAVQSGAYQVDLPTLAQKLAPYL